MPYDPERLAGLIESRKLDRYTTCTSKQRYETRADAKHAAKLFTMRKRRVAEVYKCPFGMDHWHITKKRHGEEE